MHARNLKAKWALLEDKPLAQTLVSRCRADPDYKPLLPKYQEWLDDINAQLATYPEEA